MLGILTTLSTQGSTAYNPVDSQVELKPSTEYLYNTKNIVKLSVSGSTDSNIRYKLSVNEDQSPDFLIRANELNSTITTVADTSAASQMLTLTVYIGDTGEDVLTFTEAALSSSSTETRYYNIDDIVWGFDNASGNKSCLYIAEGGSSVKKIFTDHELAKINDLVATGTTTTTTTSTTTK